MRPDSITFLLGITCQCKKRKKGVRPAICDFILTAIPRGDNLHGQIGQDWRVALASYRLSEGDVKNHIALELDQLRLIDARLRPSIQINATAIENYYQEQFVLELHRAGNEQLSLAQAAPKIREILIQQKMDQLLSSWLQTLHSQAQIRILASDSAGSQVQGQ